MDSESDGPRRVVYTAVFGRYENIVEQPVAKESQVEFICFTDDPEASSETWKIRLLTGRVQDDPTRSARQIKILGHDELSNFDQTMWIDNRIVLKRDPSHFFNEWLEGCDMALPKHDHRDSVRDEFRAVINSGFDDPYKVREQLQSYMALAPAVLEGPVYWTAILLRQNNATVQGAMRRWMDNVLRYSKRDQLSVNYALSQSSLKVNVLDLDNFQSSWHKWLRTTELPKNRAVRFWRKQGFKYPLWLRISDDVRSSRVVQGVWSRSRRILRGR